jgi:outer membrane protein
MLLTSRRIIISLLVAALPSLGSAADTAPVPETLKTPSLLQPAAPATPAVPPSPLKVPETPKAQQTMRIGYVDIARIGSESTLGKASTAKSREKQEKFQARILAKRKQLDKQKAAIEAKISTLTPQQREAKGREFQKKVEEFQKFGMNAEKELQALQEELTKALFAAIEQTAAEYGKTNRLGVVIIKRELLYLDSGVDSQDVTDGLIKLMNEKDRKR